MYESHRSDANNNARCRVPDFWGDDNALLRHHVGNSMYALHLERWFAVVGRENVKVGARLGVDKGRGRETTHRSGPLAGVPRRRNRSWSGYIEEPAESCGRPCRRDGAVMDARAPCRVPPFVSSLGSIEGLQIVRANVVTSFAWHRGPCMSGFGYWLLRELFRPERPHLRPCLIDNKTEQKLDTCAKSSINRGVMISRTQVLFLEELHDDPVETLRGIFEFIGLDFVDSDGAKVRGGCRPGTVP